MERYSEYKDSGVKWLGEIPRHWKVLPMKYCVQIKNGMDYKHVIADRGYPVIGSGGQFACASDYMYNGEVVFFGRKGTIDKPLHYKGKFWVVDTMFYAIPKTILGRFLYYVGLTIPYKYYSTATALPSMTQSDLGNNPICFPPIKEQNAIANYLDAATSKIDEAIAQQQKMIDLLNERKQIIINNAVTKGLDPNVKMKASGIDWIGDIPVHWEVMKLKYIAEVRGRVGFKGYSSSDLVEEGAYSLGGKHITNDIIDLSDPTFISWQKYYESPEIMVKKGDIVTAQRGSLGHTAIIEEDLGPTTINPSLVLITNINSYNKFLYWFLLSYPIQKTIEVLNTATAVPMLSQRQIGNMQIVLPPIKEQEAISLNLEIQILNLDKTIGIYNKQISLLQERKQIIINDVVTGKVKVV